MNEDPNTQGGLQYNIAAIRNLIRNAFTADDLRRFCQDRPIFRPIVDRFTPSQGLELMVDQAIDYCQVRLLFEELLTEVSKANPRQYDRLGPYVEEVRVRQQVVNLPPWGMPHVFKDRQQEMQALHDYLGDDRVRLISIVGQGGMGKTALACYVLRGIEPKTQAAEIALPDEPYVDGILYLSAQDTGTGLGLEQIKAGVELMVDGPAARRLANRWIHGEASLVAKVEYLLDAMQGGRYLILLDNLENSLTADGVIEKEGLRLFVEHCLTRSAGVRLIATSRQEIRLMPATLPSIRTIPLQDGLPEDEAASLLRDLDPQGRLGLRNAMADSLCESSRRLQGVPMALEILAGLLADDQTIQLEELLADEDLIGEEVINRLLDESYRRLGDGERRVMQALAVFDHPVDRTAISFLLYPWFPNLDVRIALQRLVRSFMVMVRRTSGVYSLHPLNREYAYRQLPDSVEPDAYNRHNLEMRAAKCYAGKRKPKGEWQTIEDLEAQLLEFEHRIRAKDYDGAGLLLESIDFDYLSMWGHAGKLVELREKLLGRLTEPGLIANNLGNLGLSYHALGQIRQAQTCYEQALSITREIPERLSEGIWLGDLGKAYQDQGQVEQAIVFFEGALDIARETGDRRKEGIWLGDLGDAYHDLGQFEKAIEFFEQALVIHEQVGDLRRVGAESGNLGSVYRALGCFEKAIDLYAEALRIARLVGDRWSQGVNLGRLGVAYRHLGKTEQAMEYHESALSNARAIGHRRIEGRQLGYLGDIYRLLGQTDAASQFLNEALSIARDTDDRRFEGVWLHRLGAVHCDLGQIQQAITIQREALEITREIGDRRGTSYRLLGLGRLLLANGKTVEAERCLQEARRLEASEPHARILLGLGVIQLSQSTTLAQETFEESASLCRAMLERTADLYEARFSLATALIGQAICDLQWSEVGRRGELLASALEEYESALDICAAPGIVQDVLLDLKLISTIDSRDLKRVFELLEKALEKG